MDDYISKSVRDDAQVEALTRCQPLVAGLRSEHQADRSERQEPPLTLDGLAVQELLAVAGEDAQELVGLFLEDAWRMLTAMRRAVEAGDAGQLRYEAHALKGSSATLGAMALSALCQQLEAKAERGDLEDALEKVAQAESELKQVEAALLEAIQATAD